MAPPPNQKGGPRARRFCFEVAVRPRRSVRLRPSLPNYFLYAFFFAFLAIASSFGLMEGNATPRLARGGLSLATASIVIRTDSEATALRCHTAVIALSTAVMHFRQLFSRAMHSERPRYGQQRTNARRAIFINSKPRYGLPWHGESPLSDVGARYPQEHGECHGRVVE